MMRVVYLHGFASSPQSKKARWFQERFAQKGIELEIPDLANGDFEHLTISSQLQVIEQLCSGDPVTLMGSSMGGYLAALYAARHPEVEQVILMAPAFCFAKRSINMVGPHKFLQWRMSGSTHMFHYGAGRELPLRYDLIQDAQSYEDYPSFAQQALLFHGIHDQTVPWKLSQNFAARHNNARLWLLDAGHELTESLEIMWDTTLDFLGLEGSVCRSEEEWDAAPHRIGRAKPTVN
ncbi:MAG: alpha/beta fold hydrolase [Acidobacteriaceae bacterium]|nr:alpha/beta fold hydrolase [Acidobacteriaceae bacterium]